MCGRFTLSVSKNEIKDYLYKNYQIEEFDSNFMVPRYNIAPGQELITIINDGSKHRIGTIKWGFVPFFAKDEKIGFKMINAKAETLSEKLSFRNSFKHKRCVILADGFYEWKKENNTKIPMRFLLKNQTIFPFAGIWSSYKREDGSTLYTCSIITTNANSLVSTVHDRMPVILTNETKDIWLNPNIKDDKVLSSLLIPYQADEMKGYQVSTIVNNPTNEDPKCILATEQFNLN